MDELNLRDAPMHMCTCLASMADAQAYVRSNGQIVSLLVKGEVTGNANDLLIGEEGDTYDFHAPQRLEDRVANLINWWRYQSKDAGDAGSITIMANQLERVLKGPS